jgi:hypothetical protein
MQALVRTYITAPEGVAATRASHPEYPFPFAPSRTLSAEARVQIYANAYFSRLHDALADDFEAVWRCVGMTAFQDLVRAYLQAHPPQSFTLRDLGRDMPLFLLGHPLHTEFPFLIDLARFEWALIETYDAADCAPLTRQMLKTREPAAWPALALQSIPALRIVASRWRVDEILEAVTSEAHDGRSSRRGSETSRTNRAATTASPAAVDDAQTIPGATDLCIPTTYCIWRREEQVFYRAIDETESALLTSLRRPTTFAALCETAATLLDAEVVVSRVGTYLQQWVESGMMAADEGDDVAHP